MLRWIRNLWSGSEPVAFVSAYGLAESVARLKAVTTSWSLFRVAEQAAVGRVSETRVSLRHVVPMFGNAFKPVFTGRFRQVNGQVVLTRVFGLSWFVTLFMAYWLGFCVLFVLLSLLGAAQKPAAAWMSFGGCRPVRVGAGHTRLFA